MTAPAIALALLLALASGAPTMAPGSSASAPPTDSANLIPSPATAALPPIPSGLPIHPQLAAQGRLIIVTSDPLAVPNDGVRFNITPFAEPPLGADSSFQAAVEETIGGYDAVFGLFENSGTAPVPFFTVFSNTTDTIVHLAYWPNASTLPGSTYDFALTRTTGTLWELDVNHQPFGGNASASQFDFGAAESTWLGGLGFSEIALYPTTSSAPTVCSVPLAFAVHQPSGWYLPVEAHATFSGAGGPAWGVEGRMQHPTLAPGMIVSGRSVSAVPNGTVLWTGGPVPLNLALTAPSDARGLSVVSASVAVTSASGAPVPGATVYFSDLLGGTFTPASALSGSSGLVPVTFATPNVSEAGADLLRATVTTFGYNGLAEASVSVSPAQHIVVRSLAPAPAVAPGAWIDLTFATEDTGGASLSGVYLSFDATGGRLSPAFGVSGADGTVTTTLHAPNVSAPVTVRAIVGGGGVWGGVSVNVTVHSFPPPLLSAIEVDLLVLGILAAVALGAIFVLRRRQARRPPVPVLRLPRPRPNGPYAAGATGTDPKGSVSRTRPGGGGP